MAAHRLKQSASIAAPPPEVFDLVDDHARYYAHVLRLARLLGGRLDLRMDGDEARKAGSRITLAGRLFGQPLLLEEVVTRREPPYAKSWETVGTPRFLIVGGYRHDVRIEPDGGGSRLHAAFEYDLPAGGWLRRKIGDVYGRKCVRELVQSAAKHFQRRTRRPAQA